MIQPRTSTRFALGAALLASLALTGALSGSLGSLTVNWREADGLMVGRNLCRHTGSLLFPAVDHQGPLPRVTGMELPLLNALQSALRCDDEGQTRAGRRMVLCFGIVGIFAAALLAARSFRPEATALTVAGLAFSPVYAFYSRTLQPDVPSLALGLVSLACMDRAARPGEPLRWSWYFASALALSLGALVKLPVLVFGLPLLVLLLEARGLAHARDVRSWLYPAVALLPPLVWYAHARTLQETFGVHYFYLGEPLSKLATAWSDPSFYRRIFGQRPFDTDAFAGITVLALCAFIAPRTPRYIRALALGAVVFFFLGGESAAWHTSYGLMGVPALVLGSGAALDALQERWPRVTRPASVLLMLLTVGYGIWRIRGMAPAAGSIDAYRAARAALDAQLPAGEPVRVASRGDPKLFWYLDRRGTLAGAGPGPTREPGAAAEQRVVALDNLRLGAAMRAAAHSTLTSQHFQRLFEAPEVELWLRAEPPAAP